MITLPWPDKRLTPNAKRRKHWRYYQPFAKMDRQFGWAATMADTTPEQRKALASLDKVPMTIRFYPPDNRRRDADGAIGAAKHLLDGVSDALGIDDHLFRPRFVFCDPEKPGRVEIEL